MENSWRSAESGQRKAIRCFVAVDTTGEVKEQLSGLLERVKSRTALRVKWVRPEQMHLTLVFLGEVSPDFLESAKAQLAKVVLEFRPIQCQLAGLGAFPSLTRARVLWVGLAQGSEELKRLQAGVSRVLEEIGYKPEKRPFSPHLTLGRLREPAAAEFIKEIPFESSPFTVDQLILFRSVLRPQGPEYTRLAEFRLSR
ncbi:MAG: RNA 2',3'-cyclic phosphodiesterase [candidate division WOR-3 bacterium]